MEAVGVLCVHNVHVLYFHTARETFSFLTCIHSFKAVEDLPFIYYCFYDPFGSSCKYFVNIVFQMSFLHVQAVMTEEL